MVGARVIPIVLADMWRAAEFVDKTRRGAKPAQRSVSLVPPALSETLLIS